MYILPKFATKFTKMVKVYQKSTKNGKTNLKTS